MGIKHCNRKGITYQWKVARILSEKWKNATNQGIDQRPGTCDVEGTPYWIECKTGKRPSITGAWRQCCDEQKAHGDTRPILVICHFDRFHGRESLETVTMSMETFSELIGIG